MKRIISILFVFILIMPFAGTYFWLQLRKYEVKKAVKRQVINGIPDEDLVALSFSIADSGTLLNWKHSKEFEYKGEMYDVVRSVTKGDSVTYYVWWDHEETKIEKQLASLAAGNFSKDPAAKEKIHNLNSFYFSLFFSEIKNESNIYSSNIVLSDLQICFFRNMVLSPPVPPPNFC